VTDPFVIETAELKKDYKGVEAVRCLNLEGGLALLVCSAAVIVLAYPRVVRELLPLVRNTDVGGAVGRQIREAADLFRTYRGYVWAQWYRERMAQTWTIFAVLLGRRGCWPVGTPR
jgi:hypothetical protein